MNRTEWEQASDPTLLLRYVHGQVSNRKLRFFAVACVRRVAFLLSDPQSSSAIEVADNYADALLSENDLHAAWEAAHHAVTHQAGGSRHAALAASRAAMSVYHDRPWTARATEVAVAASTAILETAGQSAAEDERRAQAQIVRCIVRFNPMGKAAPGQPPPAVVELAQEIYNHEAFARFPELRFKLIEASYPDQALLDHCSQSEHVRGCWAIDQILGKV